MTTWIFQGNPDTFDIDGLLSTQPLAFAWTVTRYAGQIAAGDRVYLWRAKGRAPDGVAGIIAECSVIEPVSDRPDDAASLPFWKNPEGAEQPASRALLQLIRTANKRQVVRREWLLDDPS
jgi:hypothetical protein